MIFPLAAGVAARLPMLKFNVEYQALRAYEYEQRFREREIKYLQRKAACLGLILSPRIESLQAVS